MTEMLRGGISADRTENDRMEFTDVCRAGLFSIQQKIILRRYR